MKNKNCLHLLKFVNIYNAKHFQEALLYRKLPWDHEGKNPIRHVIAYTLDIDKVLMI
jgi:hypothetical protein